MSYDLFLFDLDDTLLDFRASEARSFTQAMTGLGLEVDLKQFFADYQLINLDLWRRLERGEVSQEFLKVERFRRSFELHQIEIDPEVASQRYLDTLPETVVLIPGALELCQALSARGELGIITNGIPHVQGRRIQNSGLAPFISFISVSEECGHAKPDVRFFDHTVRKAKAFRPELTLIVGDRLDADIRGARNFGIDSCWFNRGGRSQRGEHRPTFEIHDLNELLPLLEE